METWIAMHAGHDAGADRRMQRQPARTQPGTTDGVLHQPDHQLHLAVVRGGSDRVLAAGQHRQPGQPQAGILHGQRGIGVRQLAFAGQRQQRARRAVNQQRLQRIQTMRLQHGTRMPRAVAGRDMQDVTGLPLHIGRCGKTDTPDRAADAARVEAVAAEQAPVVHPRCGRQHTVIGGDAGQCAQLQLPLAQGRHRGGIDIDAREQRTCTVAGQPAIDLAAEAAVVQILAIPQREQAELQPRQVRCLRKQQACRASGRIRRFTVAEGAQHEQRLRCGLQLRRIDARQRQHLHRATGRLQLRGRTPCELFGQAALAGMHHQPRRAMAIGGGWHRQRLAQPACRALAAAAIQVQHPAGDEEQAHAQAAEHHHHAPGQAEVAARVQREHAGGQLAARALAIVGAGIEHRAAGRVQLQQIMRAIMVPSALRRITGHHPHVERLARFFRQAQVDEAGAHAGQGIQRGFDALQVQRGIDGHRMLGRRRDAQHAVGHAAVPVE